MVGERGRTNATTGTPCATCASLYALASAGDTFNAHPECAARSALRAVGPVTIEVVRAGTTGGAPPGHMELVTTTRSASAWGADGAVDARVAGPEGDDAMGTACLFCEIVRGERPSARVLESDASLAFLDARPLFPGHVLVVPRAHVETLGELEPAAVAPLFLDVQRVARAVERACAAGRLLRGDEQPREPERPAPPRARRAAEGEGRAARVLLDARQKYEGEGAMEAVAASIRGALERD